MSLVCDFIWQKLLENDVYVARLPLHKKLSFPSNISLVNVNKSTEYFYSSKTSFFVLLSTSVTLAEFFHPLSTSHEKKKKRLFN